MTLVNLGCGGRYHADWVNIDVWQSGADVIVHDLRTGIPLADQSCDAVYSAALLEHLRRDDARALMVECGRVLRPGGIVRVVVPDLEEICRLYLLTLDEASRGVPGASDDYDWMMLELYDQVVRNVSGGDMLAYLRRTALPNEAFVYRRIGEIAKSARVEPPPAPPSAPSGRRPLLARVADRISRLFRRCDRPQGSAVEQFRNSGEIHHWMYDRFSLSRLLLEAGFSDPALQSATMSQIPDWERYGLDAWPDGTPVKPDCLCLEARKPMSGR